MTGLAAMLSATPALATSYCEVVQTPDGFAALRGAPASSGKMLAKMPSGAMVLLREGERNGWAKVAWCAKGTPAQNCSGRVEGWVAKRLIDVCG